MNNTIPPLDFPPDNPFVVNVPDSFGLPQTNPYCSDLTVEQITLLIAGFLALAGQNPAATTFLATVEAYVGTGFAQDLQVPGLLWTLNQILTTPSLVVTGGGVYSADWGGGVPTVTPTSTAAIGIDSVTKRQWTWVNGAWVDFTLPSSPLPTVTRVHVSPTIDVIGFVVMAGSTVVLTTDGTIPTMTNGTQYTTAALLYVPRATVALYASFQTGYMRSAIMTSNPL